MQNQKPQSYGFEKIRNSLQVIQIETLILLGHKKIDEYNEFKYYTLVFNISGKILYHANVWNINNKVENSTN